MSDLHLPEEVLQLIMWHLRLAFDFSIDFPDGESEHKILRKTLLSCSLASKTLRRLAEPVFYHTFTSDWLITALNPSPRHARLARRVRQLYVTDIDCQFEFENGKPMEHGGIIDGFLERHKECPEYLRPYIFRKNPETAHLLERLHGIPRVPAATLEFMMYTRLQDLVLADGAQAQRVLPSRFLQICAALAASSSEKITVPLVALRRFTIESRYSDKKLDDAMHLDRNDWIWDLARLPHIESICVLRILNHFSTTSRPQTSNLKALTLTSMTMFPEKLRKILTMCPVLEDLHATWSADENSLFKNEYMWAHTGAALCHFGKSLRGIHFDAARSLFESTPRDALIDLIYLSHLTSLALPIEAVLSAPVGPYSISGNDQAIIIPQQKAGKGLETPTTPLNLILPSSLRHLRIMDDLNVRVDTPRLDKQLHDLMLDPDFSKLRSVSVRRTRRFTTHIRNDVWHDQKCPRFWRVMKRV
jgi:hypothetical protein